MARPTLVHSTRGQAMFRCADCGARTCCNWGQPCTVKQPGPFPHRWVPMGSGKPIWRHVKDLT